MATRFIQGYDSVSDQTTFVTAAAGTITKIGQISIPYTAIVYAALMSISSGDTTATAGAGIMLLRNEIPVAVGATLVYPITNVFLTCTMLATPRGIFGENKLLFGKSDEGVIVLDSEAVGIYCSSTDTGKTVTVLTTLLTRPRLNQSC